MLLFTAMKIRVFHCGSDKAVQTSFDCNFERGFCGWMQESGDQGNWMVERGPTEAPETGPEYDHTIGGRLRRLSTLKSVP